MSEEGESRNIKGIHSDVTRGDVFVTRAGVRLTLSIPNPTLLYSILILCLFHPYVCLPIRIYHTLNDITKSW